MATSRIATDWLTASLKIMYDALARHHAVESIVTRGAQQEQLRKYYRFRADRWYGGIVTGDVVGCGLLCRFCWVADGILERPAMSGEFLDPHDAFRRLLAICEGRHLAQVRLSGGEPTIGRSHLLTLLSRFEVQDSHRFILETNGIPLGADPKYCRDLARFRCLHVRVSLKGACESEFTLLTGARADAFGLQIKALSNLLNAGVSCHPAVMSSFSTESSMSQLRDRISGIDPRLAAEVEIEEVIRYARVNRRLQKFGLTALVSHKPGNVPKQLI